jgi:hypothetical protein
MASMHPDIESAFSPYRSQGRGQSPGAPRSLAASTLQAPPGFIKSYTGVLVALVGLVCFAAAIAACVTEVYTLYVTQGEVVATIWSQQLCVYNVRCETIDYPAKSWCTEKTVRFEYLQAGSVLLTIYTLLIVVAGIAEALEIVSKFIPVGGGVLAWVWFWTLLQWALIAAAYHDNYCNTASLATQGFRMSVSFALYLCSWMLLSLFGIFYIVARSGIKRA